MRCKVTEIELIKKIKEHELGNESEAHLLYQAFIDLLKEKYGLANRDYDENPTKRGKEWLDIHHIMEYELDDIARRTKNVQYFEREQCINPDELVVVKTDVFRDKEKMNEIHRLYPNCRIYGSDYTLKDLKPYNIKELLVYANKIEHFLLHYLIDSIRGREVFSGGPNYLWDNSIALDIYGFDKEFMENLKSQKNLFYSLLSSEEITILYKKLIDWKKWDIHRCSGYWLTFKYIIQRLRNEDVSYISDIEKLNKLFSILGYQLEEEHINLIEKSPYKVKTITIKGIIYKRRNDIIFSEDGTTAIKFRNIFERKSFKIPYFVEGFAVGAFDCTIYLETITIPKTVKKIEDKAFVKHKSKHGHYTPIKKIIYEGTKEEWDKNFSNVVLNGIKLTCKRRCNN